jgi:hypothetical protein
MEEKRKSQALTYAEGMFRKIKCDKKLNEKAHSIEIIRTFASGGTLADFLISTGISRQKFVAWKAKSPTFNEAAMVAKEVGRSNWMKIGLENVDNREFNSKVWETFGRQNFGGTDKLTLTLQPESTPMQHYQQLIAQAACGDLSSSEIKQLMESINIGIKAHETCELQAEIDELKEGLIKMEERENEYQGTDYSSTEENKVALDGEDC